MEQPSVEKMGRDFVEHYFTVLNNTPELLHKFYGRNSSYIHGGLDPSKKMAEPVYGQREIHKKIMALQLRNCCATIRSVDTLATFGTGVLVHVHGQLSNDGQPMKSFTQTFVIAPERSANRFYVRNDIFRLTGEEESNKEDEVEVAAPQTSPEPLRVRSTGTTEGEPQGVTNEVKEPVKEPVLEQEPPAKCRVEEKPAPPAPVEVPPAIQEPPKTLQWAEVARRNLPPPGTVLPFGKPRPAPPASKTQTREKVKVERQKNPARATDTEKSRSNTNGCGTGGNGKVPPHPERHQIFVGFLPRHVTVEQLKRFFSVYGHIVDLQIYVNPNKKVSNVAFITFDGPDSVEKVLKSKPIVFWDNVHLHVEAKKAEVMPDGRSHNRDGHQDVRGTNRRDHTNGVRQDGGNRLHREGPNQPGHRRTRDHHP